MVIIDSADITLTLGYPILTGDVYVLKENVVLDAPGVPFLFSEPAFPANNVRFQFNGLAFSEGATMLSLFGNHVTVGVGANGIVSGGEGLAQGILINLGGTHGVVRNAGMIEQNTKDNSLAIYLGGSGEVYNSGQIISASKGIQMSAAGGATYVENSGAITANDNAVESLGSVNILNTGTITSQSQKGILLSSDGLSTITNLGTITSTFYAIYAQEDPMVHMLWNNIINRGVINGSVYLGNDDDYFDGRGGTINGAVEGGLGNDRYTVSDASILLAEAAGQGNDIVYSTVNFALDSGSELEQLRLLGSAQVGAGNGFANYMLGNKLANTLSGSDGDDTLDARDGADVLYGGTGTDLLLGGDEGDTLDGGDNNDQLYGDRGDDVLRGRSGNDRVDGGSDDDRLVGGVGLDTLFGGSGDDTLQGGAGTDLMYGGTEADVFVFAAISDSKLGGARDIIASDFLQGTDIVDLSAIDAKALTAGNDAFTFIGTAAFAAATAGQLRYLVSGANIIVQGDVNGDAAADFEIQINAQAAITASSVIL